VLAFQAGDTSAYRSIHERYRALVESLCRRLLGNYHDAEEATQETFIRVYKALPRFNGHYRLRPWILRIATNVSLDMLRARGRRSESHRHVVGNVVYLDAVRPGSDGQSSRNGGSDIDHDHDADPSEIVERRDQDDQVRAVLQELPEKYRTALVLREFEGLSYEEIGSALGESAAKVKALLHRAKRRFRRAWLGAGRAFGFIPLPLILWVRRLTGSAPEAPAPLAAGPAAALAGSPLANFAGTVVASAGASAPILSSAAERVVATVAAVAVTGAVGVGVIRTTSGNDAPEGETRPQALVVAPPVAGDDTSGASDVVATTLPGLVKPDPSLFPPESLPPVETPPVEPTEPAPTDPATPPNTEPPTTEPTPPPTTPPPLPPAPEFASSVYVEIGSVKLDLSLHLTKESVRGTVGEDFSFEQKLHGETGNGGWTVDLAIFGTVQLEGGECVVCSYSMSGELAAGGFAYLIGGQGTMALALDEPGDDHTWTFLYTGTAVFSEGDLVGAVGGASEGEMSWYANGAGVRTNSRLFADLSQVA
jgi:RNA polymerase sigma-70 factor, ECF subfamily